STYFSIPNLSFFLTNAPKLLYHRKNSLTIKEPAYYNRKSKISGKNTDSIGTQGRLCVLFKEENYEKIQRDEQRRTVGTEKPVRG
ncbi:MAG: hypothetical protein PUD04_09970, partial [Firmicutes bacterium]|nr:hypothetical protein [Bacillota bacterium]